MIPISPDTQQNILVAGMLLVKHNAFALLCVAGILASLVAAVLKPSRASVLSLVGCALLLLGFEYQKHIMEPLIAQTTTSLITARPSYRLARIIEVGLEKGIPFALYGSGVISLVVAGFITLHTLYSKLQK